MVRLRLRFGYETNTLGSFVLRNVNISHSFVTNAFTFQINGGITDMEFLYIDLILVTIIAFFCKLVRHSRRYARNLSLQNF